jgi:hypothetical protein
MLLADNDRRIEWTNNSVKICSQRLMSSTIDNLRRDGLFVSESAFVSGGDDFAEDGPDFTGKPSGSTSTFIQSSISPTKKASVRRESRAGSLSGRMGSLTLGNSLAMELEVLDEELKVRQRGDFLCAFCASDLTCGLICGIVAHQSSCPQQGLAVQ